MTTKNYALEVADKLARNELTMLTRKQLAWIWGACGSYGSRDTFTVQVDKNHYYIFSDAQQTIHRYTVNKFFNGAGSIRQE